MEINKSNTIAAAFLVGVESSRVFLDESVGNASPEMLKGGNASEAFKEVIEEDNIETEEESNFDEAEISVVEQNRKKLSSLYNFKVIEEIWKDKQACYAYLKDIKWGKKSFECKKCSYDKYRELEDFGRKCNKCGYLESVTSHTIFHSVKFPIEKSFQILFLLAERRKVKVVSIARAVKLRQATCSRFIKKVMQHYQQTYIGAQKRRQLKKLILIDKEGK